MSRIPFIGNTIVPVIMMIIGAAAAAQPVADSGRGRTLYAEVGCYQCHGYEGQGAITTGPKIAPDPMPYAAFVQIVRHSARTMPAYGVELLPDPDLAAVYAYLKTIPDAPPVKELPLLDLD